MGQVLKRSEAPKEQTWNLGLIFADDEAWEQEAAALLQEMEAITSHRGHLTDSADSLLAALALRDSLSNRLDSLYVYAHQASDTDLANSRYQGYQARALTVLAAFGEKTAFMKTELMAADEFRLRELLADSRLAVYRVEFDRLLAKRAHILSETEEAMLAALSPVLEASQSTAGILNNADLRFEAAVDQDGQEQVLNHSRYGVYLESQDRVLRESAFRSLYKGYRQFAGSFASTLSSTVKLHATMARLRHFGSAREAALSENFIPEHVYDALVDTVSRYTPNLHRYMALRKQVLGVDELRMYDLYVPMIKDCNLYFSFEEARDIVLEAVAPLGAAYVRDARRVFDERWIDYVENEGKRSGAYSGGAYSTAPYILMSWQGTIDNLFTLIHELGHSMHSFYSRANQPYIYGDYSIFVAEVASTCNENLLNHYLLQKYQADHTVKAYLLNRYLDGVKGTVYRQTQFAEFEKLIHARAEVGQSLTVEDFCALYAEINSRYYGDAVTMDEDISYEWARIPHFYYNFYVYQYATGLSAATALANRILTGDPEKVQAYLNFLASGCSDTPIAVLQKAGVDMSTPQPIENCLETFADRLQELEALLK
ncbi:MAG: oligoendopeptidase F [Lachnospiraceae bacterium]|nr:oligoendopeptidase F [Lachnospiraceae bacterium]MDY5742182.1 oligoendopeptidase F [Lachnospiraceae bacterium]